MADRTEDCILIDPAMWSHNLFVLQSPGEDKTDCACTLFFQLSAVFSGKTMRKSNVVSFFSPHLSGKHTEPTS